MNFTELPNDIKLYIFHINKWKDKHNKQLQRNLSEIKHIFELSQLYFNFIKECLGVSVWEHEKDYKYWIELEENDYLQNYEIKDIQNKSLIVKYIIKNHLITKI
jgi:hypothetical protein